MSCHVPLCKAAVDEKQGGLCEKCRQNIVCVVHEYVDHVLDGAGKVRTTVRLCMACRHGWSKR